MKRFQQEFLQKLLPDEIQAVRRVAPAVVKIIATDSSGFSVSQGSGFIIAANGVIISNYHVIQGAKVVEILTSSGIKYPLQGVVDFDVKRDLVVLKIDADELPYVKLGKSRTLDIEERVLALGYPAGFDLVPTKGHLGKRRNEGKMRWLQHSASILPGSSGGPLINMKGEVVGINAAFQLGDSQQNFAIPIEYILP